MAFHLYTVGELAKHAGGALAHKTAAAKAAIASKGALGAAAAKAGGVLSGIPVYGLASGAGAGIGAFRGYVKARREAKKLGIDRKKNKQDWKLLRNKRVRNNAAAGAGIGLAAGLATGLMSDIEFNTQTRQFARVNRVRLSNRGSGLTYGVTGTLGGLGYSLYQNKKKKEYIQSLIDKGVDPGIAKRRAESRYGGSIGNFVKGGAAGWAANWGAKNVVKAGRQLGV